MNTETVPQTFVDTPEAYEPVLYPAQVARISTMEQMDNLVTLSRRDPEAISRVVDAETAVLGVGPEEPDQYFERRANFYEQATEYVTGFLPHIKANTITRVAQHLAAGDQEAFKHWSSIFHSRLSTLQGLDVQDPLLVGGQGAFRHMSRRIGLNGELFLAFADDQEKLDRTLADVVLAHELIHGMQTGAITTNALQSSGDLISRLGLNTQHVPEGRSRVSTSELQEVAIWPNEAYVEDLRQRVTGSDTVGYTLPVAILRTLKELDPELGLELDAASFGQQGPGKVFGRIENLIGPNGIEEIEALLKRSDAVPDETTAESIIDQVVELFKDKHNDLREPARAALERHWQELRGRPILPPEWYSASTAAN